MTRAEAVYSLARGAPPAHFASASVCLGNLRQGSGERPARARCPTQRSLRSVLVVQSSSVVVSLSLPRSAERKVTLGLPVLTRTDRFQVTYAICARDKAREIEASCFH